MFLGANNGGQAKAVEGSSGVEGGVGGRFRCCTSADRSREEAVRKIEEPAIGASAGLGGEKEGRKEGSAGLARQFMATGNNAAVGRQRVLPSPILPPYVDRTPAVATELARLYGPPRLTSHPLFSPPFGSGRVTCRASIFQRVQQRLTACLPSHVSSGKGEKKA